MSVTTSTRDEVSLEVRSPARDDAKKPGFRPTSARANKPGIVERILGITPPMVLGLFLFIGWYIGTTRGLINSLILPTPPEFFPSLANGITSGLLLNRAIGTTQAHPPGFPLAAPFL